MNHLKAFSKLIYIFVPLEVIEQAIILIISGDIVNYRYDKESQAIVKK